jgi:hypothetical protein
MLEDLVLQKESRMNTAPNPTSNDLLFHLRMEYPRQSLNYAMIVQSAEEVQDIQNAPSISMGPYLSSSGQIRLLSVLSIYSLRGSSREQLRMLYMNATALRIWKEMGKQAHEISSQHRPPRAALLAFGVPFSE